MGSLIPFPDLNLNLNLNLHPDPNSNSNSTNTSTAAMAATIVPKIEPKLEPFDELPPFSHPHFPPGHFPNPNPVIDSPNSNPNSAAVDPPTDENNVYAEFYRISELFRTAFAQRLENQNAVVEPDEENDDSSGADLDDSRAIVPVPEENNQLSTVVVTSRRKYNQRGSELVRVMNLTPEDERHFRGIVRRTRMLFDSLHVLCTFYDEKRLSVSPGRRVRGDCRAASWMKDKGLWLNRDKRIVGSIPGIQIGDVFFFRMEICVVGLHGQVQAGIDYLSANQSSNGEPVATSVIVSGGYEDDDDGGDVIIYTGHGGQDKNSRQCCHQKLVGGNLGLERSMHYGVEVRVIRGFKYDGSINGKVYVYDGLYRVVEAWFDVGKSGFGVYKFKLVRMDNQPQMGSAILRFAQNVKSSPLAARPMGYICLDISAKKENCPVYLFNDVDNDHEPMYYEYQVTSVFPPFVYHVGGNGTGCACVSGCSQDCFCISKNGGDFPYDHNGLLVRGKPLIFECGPHCRCPPTCRNRVSQNGVRHKFEVFRSRETSWGVRSLELIQAGSFVCEYAGVILTREQAQVFAMNGDNLIYPNRFTDRWKEWGDLSPIFEDYVRPEHPSIPPLDFAMDVSRMRNVACYMSHSSSPNVLVQLVLYDHNNVCFPHIMLFALENIPPMREISLDYGVADEWSGKLRICN